MQNTNKNIKSIMLAEKQSASRDQLTKALVECGYNVITTNHLDKAKQVIHKTPPDLIVMEWLSDGVIPFIREHHHQSPIFCYSKQSRQINIVQSLHAGASDFIRKPCYFPELLARIERVLENKQEIIHYAGITLNTRAGIAEIANKPITLTSAENAILSDFMHQPNTAKTRSELKALIGSTASQSNIIDAFIKSLRSKHPLLKQSISTIYGHGYIFTSSER